MKTVEPTPVAPPPPPPPSSSPTPAPSQASPPPPAHPHAHHHPALHLHAPVAPPIEGRHPFVRATLAVTTILAVVSILGMGAYELEPASRGIETTDDAYVDAHVVYAAPEVAGRVTEVLVDDNEPVRAGQLLVRIDPSDYQAKYEQARGQREQAEGQVKQALAQVKVARATAAQLHAQVGVVEANLTKAVADLRRYRSLSGEAISKLTLDAAQTAVESTTAQRAAAIESAAGADAQAEFVEASVITAKAALTAARGVEALAKLNVSYCDLRAPIDGYVTRKTVEVGNYVGIGQPLLIIVPRNVYVTANFKETQMASIRPGQRVSLTVDAYPGLTLTGRVVSRMDGTGAAFALLPPENATGNFVKVVQRVPTKILIDTDNADPNQRLAPGMSVVPSVFIRDQTKQAPR